MNPLFPVQDPAATYTRAMRLLARGDYERGWPAYEARSDWAATGIRKPALPFPEWRGESVRRLLVWPEQGLGDKIMFARYVPLLDAQVTILCEPSLERLFRANFDVEVIAASGPTEFPDPDAWVMFGSLPYQLDMTDIPGAPYLSAKPRKSSGRIGVCARGNPIHPNDANRSLPIEDARLLLELPEAVDLHVEASGARDMLETAEIIAGLDRVITVDTAVAHVAGAMGRPVSILLPAIGPDWRWGAEGDRSIWYPTATLFRQQPGEPWSSVIRRATRER